MLFLLQMCSVKDSLK